MKNSFKIIILLCTWYIINTGAIHAQSSKTIATNTETPKMTALEKSFIKIFSKSDPSRILKDSVSMYAINFTIDVVKDKNNKTLVSKITANDSLGYILCPHYSELKKLDYRELFLLGEKKISIIMPILIYGHTEKEIKYKDADGNPLISLRSAVNTAFHLYTDLPYNNLKDGPTTYPRYPPEYNERHKSTFIRRIMLEPYVFNLTTISN
ncbi:hypothetical protein FFJ24_000715 [Pedobacter sp. KBS0701]|uniref:hypothetical protein n=1 Tax=Pedobacter sp. KBS0701 TaxID=2578106 RepID=UPI00110ED5DB|nr:hypothetical protein [Pedobacter sp. KBS0701]QDW23429.1 hypothetical protein FFJ24_000715 [Pedobacter sp. KBS0701]